MSHDTNVADLDLSDAELLTVLRNHGIDRRSLMKLLGVGAGVTALSGTAGGRPPGGNRIDEVYGAPYAADDTVPSGLVDHTVELHVHEPPGAHPGFPMGPGEGSEPEEGPETYFDPVGLHVRPGEVVEFTVHGAGLHTVTSFDPKYNEPPFLVLPDRVPTEHGFTSPPVAEDDSWLYRFTTKGVYDLFCLPHVSLGMVMRIVVFDHAEDDIDDSTFDEPEADPDAPLPPAAQMVLDNPLLDPEAIVRESDDEIAWSELQLPLS